MAEIFFSAFAQPAPPHEVDAEQWRRAVERARLHKCAPLFAQRLEALGMIGSVPREEKQRLAEERRATAVANLRGRQQLHELGAKLGGVRLIALKGACLARTAYPDLSLRPMADLDVLARPGDLAAARAALLALGYSQKAGTPDTWKGKHEEPPFKREGALPIELHNSLLDEGHPFSIDAEALWQRARAAGDVPGLWYLAPEDQFLHVCLHAAFHHELSLGLYAFLDLRAMAERCAIDWDGVLARAKAWKAERCAYLALRVSERATGAVFPATFMAALRPPGFSERLVDAALTVVRSKPDRRPDPAVFLADFLAHLRRKGWRAMGRAVRRRFLLPIEQRPRWPGSPQPSWRRQISPLVVGTAGLVASRDAREALRARLAGVRLSRWMAEAREDGQGAGTV
jgi:putative nucleotidyltransferase-like protein